MCNMVNLKQMSELYVQYQINYDLYLLLSSHTKVIP